MNPQNHNTMEKENTTAGKTACYAKFKIKNPTENKAILCLLPGVARDLETLSRLGFKADAIAKMIPGYDGWEFEDFLQVIRSVRCDLKRLIIQNCTADPAIFDESIVIGRTIKAYEPSIKRFNLQDYINVEAFDRSKITIVFDDATPLDGITYMAITLPPNANIIITFVFDL